MMCGQDRPRDGKGRPVLLPWDWSVHQDGPGNSLTCSDTCRALAGLPAKT